MKKFTGDSRVSVYFNRILILSLLLLIAVAIFWLTQKPMRPEKSKDLGILSAKVSPITEPPTLSSVDVLGVAAQRARSAKTTSPSWVQTQEDLLNRKVDCEHPYLRLLLSASIETEDKALCEGVVDAVLSNRKALEMVHERLRVAIDAIHYSNNFDADEAHCSIRSKGSGQSIDLDSFEYHYLEFFRLDTQYEAHEISKSDFQSRFDFERRRQLQWVAFCFLNRVLEYWSRL
jgi:hypothetical protein